MRKTRFFRDVMLAFDEGDLMTGLGEKKSGAHADDPAADDRNLFSCHLLNL